MTQKSDPINLHPDVPEVFNSNNSAAVFSPDKFGPDMSSYCAGLFFGLKKGVFSITPSQKDPRGFIELYGGIAEKTYVLHAKEGDIRYRSLACFYSHFSFIADEDFAVSVSPNPFGITMLITDVKTGEILDSSQPELPQSGDDNTFPDFLWHHLEIARKKSNHNKEGRAE